MPLPDGPEAPYLSFGHMNVKNTVVNEFLLKKRLSSEASKVDLNTVKSLTAWNERESWIGPFLMIMFLLTLTIAPQIAFQEEPAPPAALLWFVTCFFGLMTMTAATVFIGEYRHFRRFALRIIRDENTVEDVLAGYAETKETAKREFSDAQTAYFFCLDWTRAQILKIAARIEEGNESARGELRVKFKVAKKLFDDDLDRGCGHEVFFDQRLIMTFMKSHKEDFERASLPCS